MSSSPMQKSVAQIVKCQAARLKKAVPAVLAVTLASASLIPVVKDISPEVAMGVTILSGIGMDFLKDIGKDFLDKLAKKDDEEICKELEDRFLELWNVPGGKGTAFRQEISQFLQRNGIFQIAMDAAPQDLRSDLAQSFANLANQFDEFGWVLEEIRGTLAEIQKIQIEQLAIQREHLDLQREQLAKTNFLLKIQRDRKEKTTRYGSQKGPENLPPEDLPCPYKGLSAFQTQDVEFFFGREGLLARLLVELTGASFLAITGPSGSGKSSLVRAGLIPALWNDEIPGSKDWKILIMRPGAVPLEDLAVRISLQTGGSASNLLEDLHLNPDSLRLALKQIMISQPEEAKFVLVVDQFEEIFTLCADESQRSRFVVSIINAAQKANGQVIVILTLRADYYGSCAAFSDLAKMLSASQILVGAMDEDELRRAIEMPAKHAGLELEPGLTEMILQDARGETGTLPMVSHALMEIWNRRSGHCLKVASYQSFGGLRQAIASTADEMFLACSEDDQERVKEIFLRLVHLDDPLDESGYRATRQRVLVRDLIPAENDNMQFENLFNRLVNARLIVKDVGPDAEPSIEVAHEALFQRWERLRSWLEEDLEIVRLRQRVSEAAREWESGARDEAFLIHRGGRLEDALKLYGKMNAQNQEYLKACETIQHKAERFRRFITIGFAFGLGLMMLIAVLAGFQWQRAEKQTRFALARQLSAQSQSMIAANLEESMTPVLLAIQSMKMYSTSEAAVLLQKNIFSPPVLDLEPSSTAQFSPDSKFVVTGGEDKTIRVWDVSTRKKSLQMSHDDIATNVVFSPDGKLVASGSQDHTARVWDAMTGNEKLRIQHGGPVKLVALDSDVLVSVTDNAVWVWDAVRGIEIARNDYLNEIQSIEVLPGENRVITTTSDAAYVWDYKTGAVITREADNMEVIIAKDMFVVFAGCEQWLIDGRNCNSSIFRVWNASAGKEVSLVIPKHTVGSADISPDGRLLALSSVFSNSVSVWDLETGQEILSKDFGDYVWSISFSPDGEFVAVGLHRSAYVIDAASGVVVARYTTEDNLNLDTIDSVSSILFSPDGRYILTDGLRGAVLWEAMPGQEITHITHQNNGYQYAMISPDKRYIIVGKDGLFEVWDVTLDKKVSQFEANGTAYPIALSTGGKYLAVENNDRMVHIWDTATGREAAGILSGDDTKNIAFHPNGEFIASGKGDHIIDIRDTMSGAVISRLSHDKDVIYVAFNPDGKLLASATFDTFWIWDAVTGKEMARIANGNLVQSLSFSPDSKFLITIDGLGGCRIFETKTGEEFMHDSMNHHIDSAEISTNGKFLVSGGCDLFVGTSMNCVYGVVRVWDLSTSEEITQVVHQGEILAVAFSADGKNVISNGGGITRTWLFQQKDLIDNACSQVTRNLTKSEWQKYIGDILPYTAVCQNLPIEMER